MFDIHADFFAQLPQKDKDDSIRLGGLHICKGIAGWFGTSLYSKPEIVQLVVDKEITNIKNLLEFIEN